MKRLRSARGFTLAELMIVVAIMGVLAALSIYGVRRYLVAAKASEAKHGVGNMARSAFAAFERENVPSETVGEGSASTKVSHQLCETAVPVPAFVPKARKYQPITAEGVDFNSGDTLSGWKCLRYNVNHPIYHQYHYTKGSSPVAPASPIVCNGECFEAGAMGDLNGNGTPGRYARTGYVNTATGALKMSSFVYVDDEAE